MADESASASIEEFLAKHSSISALPENTTRLIRMTRDPDCDIKRLGQVIGQDAALTGRIMRAVNSSFYSLPSKITRLDHAISYMGLKAVKEVVLAESLGALCKPVKFGKYDARDLWDHSMGVAILARESCRSNPSRANPRKVSLRACCTTWRCCWPRRPSRRRRRSS
ncbi:hypothetical protein BH09PLA1_BH09PLA1_29750 [soil metagenome]